MQNYEIDEIINLMKRYTPKKDFDGELEEQDAAPAAGGGGGEAAEYPTVTKWESGVTRGPANQIGLTKWRDTVKLTRGKANTLL
jgi:hypothetical protein